MQKAPVGAIHRLQLVRRVMHVVRARIQIQADPSDDRDSFGTFSREKGGGEGGVGHESEQQDRANIGEDEAFFFCV